MKKPQHFWFSPYLLIFFVIPVLVGCTGTSKDLIDAEDISLWLTTGDKTSLFEQIKGLSFTDSSRASSVIEVDTTQQFQTIDGFGYALTGGSASLIHEKLNAEERTALLKELFLTDGTNIGVSYLRVSIGASDLDDH
ncbi:MAG TPA: hypothetical protein VIQ51_14785, partial [Chryseosolibacter sp.]